MRALATFATLILLGGFAAGANRPSSATVTFILDFPGSNPSRYQITVASDGSGSYSSNGQLNQDAAPADPAPLSFTLSAKVRDEIFDLAQRSHYFTGKVDSGNKNLANTGAKTLTYKDDQRNNSATYNYSQNPAVQQLTAVFQNLSTTLECGRRLTFFHKYQKLALDDDLKRMEEMQRDHSLGDIQSIAPILHDIANDSSVIRVSRARALRLLAANTK